MFNSIDQLQGEGAYVVVSILDDQGAYDQTLYVGDDEWYRDITQCGRTCMG